MVVDSTEIGLKPTLGSVLAVWCYLLSGWDKVSRLPTSFIDINSINFFDMIITMKNLAEISANYHRLRTQSRRLF